MTPTLAQTVKKLSDEQALELLYDWDIWAREKQRQPLGDWRVWLILAGRGFGKTRTGAQWTLKQIESGACQRFALVGRTASDVRDVMVEGESGILSSAHPHRRPIYQPSKRRLTFPNGATATTYSAEEPDTLRGPQHDGFWADESASWRFEDAWDQLMFGLRLGKNPRGIVTTTPRPTPLMKSLIASPTTHITRGNTYENRAHLAPAFFEQIIRKYEGTRLGRQELNAELLDDVEGALWQRESMIEQHRVREYPELYRIAIAIDPAITSLQGSDETGIIIGGVAENGHAYILGDESLRASPDEWAKKAIFSYYRYHADRIIAETNQGGDMVETIMHMLDASLPYQAVHATRGKYLRAEPIAALYERGLVHHVGTFPELEDQQCGWVQGEKSPDRLDALVWLLTALMLNHGVPLQGDEDMPPPYREGLIPITQALHPDAPALPKDKQEPIPTIPQVQRIDPFSWIESHGGW